MESLDFECESCGAVYPGVEKLRAEYGDRITYVVRFFPLPGHRNAVPAAKAVQAAANQGKFEAMYMKDMTRFIIDQEIDDGKALKVTGTPTFFVNGEKFTGVPSYEGLSPL